MLGFLHRAREEWGKGPGGGKMGGQGASDLLDETIADTA